MTPCRPSPAALVLPLVLLFSGCASVSKSEAERPPLEAREGGASYSVNGDEVALRASPQSPEGNGGLLPRVLIRNASLELETGEPAEARAKAAAIASRAGGFVEHEWASDDRRSSVGLRIPVAKLDATLDELEKLGDVRQRSVSSQDVTARAIDLDARARALAATRDRLRALLEKAQSVGDVIAVEKELARVQGELEGLEGQLKEMVRAGAFSSVSVTFERPRILGPLGYLFYGIGWGFSKLFLIR